MQAASATNTVQQPKAQRLLSLDALRGFDMFWIVCGEGIFHGIAAVIKSKYGLIQNTINWQIKITGQLSAIEKIFVTVSNQLHHTIWNGLTFYDLIFPLFIFIAGVSMPYSFSSQLHKTGASRREGQKKIYAALIKRTLLLVLLGMVVNGALQFKGYEQTRFASVLGRIALSCFFAALIYLNTSVRWQIIWLLAILLGYWAAMMLIPVPGYGAGSITPEGNLSAYIDRLLLPGKLHRMVYDPEGLLSTVPAIASAMLGIFAGEWLRKNDVTQNKKTGYLLLGGAVLLLLGLVWSIFFPVNKNIWSSSYVVVTAGLSTLLLAIFYYVIDVLQIKKWCMPFVWMGCNAILIYMVAHGLINFEATSHFLFGGFFNMLPATWYDALLWTGVALLQFALLYFLYRKKIFLKI
jgi:predicted acyltransferase